MSSDMEAGHVMGFFRTLLAFLLAVIVGAIAVTAIAAQVNLAAIASVGAEVPLDVRIDATVTDLANFGPLIGVILLLGFGIAFPVARGIIGLIPSWRTFGYTLAGFVAVITVMLAIKAYYAFTLHSGITPVPASRTLLGMVLMGLGGALGGLTFAAVAKRN